VHISTIGRLMQRLKSGEDRRTAASSTTAEQTASGRSRKQIANTSKITAASSTSRKRKADQTD
jgi:hypothetical protein